MTKKLFAVILSVVMLMSMVTLQVAAEEGYDYYPPEEEFILRNIDLSKIYSNGQDGTYEVTDGVLHMVKDKSGSNFSEIIWSDGEDAMTDTVSLAFDAKVSGGYGTSWDGYAVSLRTDTGDDVEMVRLVPTETGVDITKGSGREIIASIYGTGYHAYTLVYHKGNDTLTVFVDGKTVMDTVPLGFTGKKQHGILIKSSNLEATGVQLWMGEVELRQYEYYVRTAPILGDGIVPTMPPTAAPTDPPVPGTPVKIRDLDVAGLYSNGKDGTYEVNNGILYMVKDKKGTNFNEILWADQEDSRTETTTFAFDAMVEGGVGTSWDGYTVALRTNRGGNCELVRLVPTETGVDLTIGAGRAILAQVEGTGYHAYSVVFNKGEDTVTVYADGAKVIEGATLGWGTNVQNGYYIHSGNNSATGVELRMGNVELWDGAYVRTASALDPSATKVPTAPPTEQPTAKPTKAPVTAPPTAPPTAVPTEKPVTSAPTELPPGDYFIRNVDVYGVYSNGPNGSYEVLDNPYHGELHMIKDKPGSNFSEVLWSDAEDAMTDTVTLAFDAKVSGGYGTSWDGFAIALWQTDYGNCELVRMVPTATGVDVTRGAGGKTIAKVAGTGYHAYTCVYNKADDWVTVYVDGDKVIDGAKLGFTGKTQHGYFINSGHNDATGAEMWLGEVETWKYASYVRTAPLLTDGQTLPPKPEVTPTPEPTPVCTTGEPTAPPEPEPTPDCNLLTPEPTGEPELTGSVSIEGDAERTIYVGDTIELTAITTLRGEPTYYEPWIFHWWANTPDVIRIDQPQTLFNYSNKAKVTALAEGDVVLTVDADFFLSPSRSTSLYATDSVIIHVRNRDAEPTPRPYQPTKETLTIAEVTAPLGEGYADVEVPITLAGVDNAAGLQIALTYQDGLTLKSIRKGEALPSLFFTTGDDLTRKPIILLWDGERGDTDPNGVVAYLTFTVPVESEDAYMITATIQALYDDDMEDIYATVFTGSIAVKEQILPGDVSGDNVLNAKDVTLLRRTVAQSAAGNMRLLASSGVDLKIADVNGDGVVNAKDITLLRRTIAQG